MGLPMFRKFCCCLALAMSVSILAGCSGTSSPPKEDPEKKRKEMEEYQKQMQNRGGPPKTDSGK